jgi:hypothetical protein
VVDGCARRGARSSSSRSAPSPRRARRPPRRLDLRRGRCRATTGALSIGGGARLCTKTSASSSGSGRIFLRLDREADTMRGVDHHLDHGRRGGRDLGARLAPHRLRPHQRLCRRARSPPLICRRPEPRLVVDREARAEHHRAAQRIGVDSQRIRRRAPAPAPPRRRPRAPARSREGRQVRLQVGVLGVEAIEDDPLVAAEEIDALIEGRRLEIAPVEIRRQLGHRLVELLAIGRAEQPLARGKPPRESARSRPRAWAPPDR